MTNNFPSSNIAVFTIHNTNATQNNTNIRNWPKVIVYLATGDMIAAQYGSHYFNFKMKMKITKKMRLKFVERPSRQDSCASSLNFSLH